MSKTRRNQAGYRPRNGQGKGDAPRNMGPKFRENYEEIDWHRDPAPCATNPPTPSAKPTK